MLFFSKKATWSPHRSMLQKLNLERYHDVMTRARFWVSRILRLKLGIFKDGYVTSDEVCSFSVVTKTNDQKLNGLQQQLFILLLFWRPAVWNQGISRATLPPEVLGDNASLMSQIVTVPPSIALWPHTSKLLLPPQSSHTHYVFLCLLVLISQRSKTKRSYIYLSMYIYLYVSIIAIYLSIWNQLRWEILTTVGELETKKSHWYSFSPNWRSETQGNE